MHETFLVNDLMREIIATAHAQQATRVTVVQVWLGALSHFSADHFREHFVDAARGSIAADAEVQVTLSDDIHHPHANGIVLDSIQVEH